MTNPSVSSGAIFFVGPPHVPTLEGFTYLVVLKVQDNSATVRKPGPDYSEESPEIDVKVAILRYRIVAVEESGLWPGSYGSHQIAFVQTGGAGSDQCAYSRVTTYSM